jgi:hypothetical protein
MFGMLRAAGEVLRQLGAVDDQRVGQAELAENGREQRLGLGVLPARACR